MRKWLIASAALAATAQLAAAPPQSPAPVPPAQLPGIVSSPQTGQPETLPNPGASPTPADPNAAIQAPAQVGMAPATAGTSTPTFRDTHAGPPDRAWFSVGPMYWWLTPARVPLLAVADNGATLGGDDEYGAAFGVQASGGWWLDRCHRCGVDLNGFILERRAVSNVLASNAAGVPFIARPIVDLLTAAPSQLLVSSPGALAGSIRYDGTARFAGAGAGFVRNLAYNCDWTFDMTFGFRYLDLDE